MTTIQMTLLPGGRTPTKFQYGDLVRARRYSFDGSGGGTVEGVIIQAANRDPKCLHEGNVEIGRRLPGGGYTDREWVRATEVICSALDQAHPLASMKPVEAIRWVCGCGEVGIALSQKQADTAFAAHRAAHTR